MGELTIAVMAPGGRIRRVVTGGHDEGSRVEVDGVLRPLQFDGPGCRGTNLLAHPAGAVLKIKTGAGVHREAGVVLGDSGGQDGPLGGRGTFLQAEAAVHAALRADHLGLLLQAHMKVGVIPGTLCDLGLGIKGNSGLLEEGPEALLHQAGAALLADIGGLAA
jgi:hypothetical protein